jgi:allophanate hydrolase subunit 1
LYEFVRKGDPAVVGITKLDGVTMEELKRPRRAKPFRSLPAGAAIGGAATTVSASLSPDA